MQPGRTSQPQAEATAQGYRLQDQGPDAWGQQVAGAALASGKGASGATWVPGSWVSFPDPGPAPTSVPQEEALHPPPVLCLWKALPTLVLRLWNVKQVPQSARFSDTFGGAFTFVKLCAECYGGHNMTNGILPPPKDMMVQRERRAQSGQG